MKFTLCLFATILAYVAGAAIAPQAELDTVPRLRDQRIIGGSNVNIAVHPHQITLRRKSILYPENPYTHYCGGSIYSKDIVITAAHCVIGQVPSQYKVVAGTNDRRGSNGVIVPVQRILYHEYYNGTSYDNDVAILVLGSSLPLNDFTIKPIELAKDDPIVGALSTITGWGTTEHGYSPETLLEVQAPVVSNEDCFADYKRPITDSMLCAGYRGVGGKDACQGDSGGPLVVNGKLTGIVSWGFGCALPEYPGVYARVPYLYSWLMQNIAQIESELA